ncbi:MAG: TolC family protein [Deltaproteobacteria bacterium]|nr:TolC family protein [Deltaproteobacteria bacterium]
MHFGLTRIRPIPACVWVMIFFLLTPVMALGQNYRALSLDECLALAREQNPVLSASREKIRELLADYNAARSKFFPRLVLTSYYDRVPPNRFTAGALTNQELFKREAITAVTGKQIIFDGLKTYNNTRAARYGSEAQKEEVQRTTDEVAFSVTEAFYRLIEAKENLKVAREALGQRQEFAKLTNAFFQAGKITHLDSFRAQSQVSEAEQAVVEGDNAVRLAREILSRTIGLKDPAPVDIKGTLPQEFAAAAAVDTLWQETLRTNPELKRLSLEIEQSQTLVKAARGSYLPEVSLQAGSDVRHRDLGGTKPEWIAGVFMEYPFFEGGLTKAQVAKAHSQSLQLLEKKRDRLNGIKVDLTTAWKDQDNARQGVATTRQTIATNQEAYASAEALYRHGKAIGLDVLQAQVDLTSSRFSYIKYAVAYEIGRARLKQIAGSKAVESLPESGRGGQQK